MYYTNYCNQGAENPVNGSIFAMISSFYALLTTMMNQMAASLRNGVAQSHRKKELRHSHRPP